MSESPPSQELVIVACSVADDPALISARKAGLHEVVVYEGELHWTNCEPCNPLQIKSLKVTNPRERLEFDFFWEGFVGSSYISYGGYPTALVHRPDPYRSKSDERLTFMAPGQNPNYETDWFCPNTSRNPKPSLKFQLRVQELLTTDNTRCCYVVGTWIDRSDDSNCGFFGLLNVRSSSD